MISGPGGQILIVSCENVGRCIRRLRSLRRVPATVCRPTASSLPTYAQQKTCTLPICRIVANTANPFVDRYEKDCLDALDPQVLIVFCPIVAEDVHALDLQRADRVPARGVLARRHGFSGVVLAVPTGDEAIESNGERAPPSRPLAGDAPACRFSRRRCLGYKWRFPAAVAGKEIGTLLAS